MQHINITAQSKNITGLTSRLRKSESHNFSAKSLMIVEQVDILGVVVEDLEVNLRLNLVNTPQRARAHSQVPKEDYLSKKEISLGRCLVQMVASFFSLYNRIFGAEKRMHDT